VGGKTLHVIFIILVVAVAFQLYLKKVASAGALGYYGSWESAVEDAKDSGKPILLNFSGDWCPSCQRLEEGTFSDKKVQHLAKNFVCVRIDPRESDEAAEFKKTRLVPEVVFLTSGLKVLGRMEDRSIPGVLSYMQRVLKKVNKR
jgi:thiol:disulfide interchange protein